MTASILRLASHAHFCVDGDYCIFLDLRNDGYLCVGKQDIEALQGDEQHHSPSCTTLAGELVHSGVFTRCDTGRPIVATRATMPARALVAEVHPCRTLEALCRFMRMVRSSIWAHWALTNWPLQRTVQFARQRKAELDSSTPDQSLLARLVGEYNQWRPFFPRAYLCLFDSLALFDILIRHRVRVDWIYGVQAEPFEAHCWLQTGDLVVNDTLERIAPFTPIMVV
jgi:hypothetical protein